MHRLHIPVPPLAAFIRCFWYSEGAPQPHTRERLMPNGEASIVFNLRDEEMRLYDAPDALDGYTSCGFAGLTGPRTHCFAIDTASQERVIGIQFRPGGTFPFFREPACEVANQSVSLDCLWRGAGETREQLLTAPSVDTMFAILERTLLARLVRPLELHPAIGFALTHIVLAPHVATVSGVIDRIGLSQRRLIDLFHDQVGLTPKAFCRVRRFQRVLESVHRKPGVDWAQVALDGGYYDQAHFIHDFQSFSGMTPAAYLARATEHLNHVPMA